jgi:hypothetical protein
MWGRCDEMIRLFMSSVVQHTDPVCCKVFRIGRSFAKRPACGSEHRAKIHPENMDEKLTNA